MHHWRACTRLTKVKIFSDCVIKATLDQPNLFMAAVIPTAISASLDTVLRNRGNNFSLERRGEVAPGDIYKRCQSEVTITPTIVQKQLTCKKVHATFKTWVKKIVKDSIQKMHSCNVSMLITFNKAHLTPKPFTTEPLLSIT